MQLARLSLLALSMRRLLRPVLLLQVPRHARMILDPWWRILNRRIYPGGRLRRHWLRGLGVVLLRRRRCSVLLLLVGHRTVVDVLLHGRLVLMRLLIGSVDRAVGGRHVRLLMSWGKYSGMLNLLVLRPPGGQSKSLLTRHRDDGDAAGRLSRARGR